MKTLLTAAILGVVGLAGAAGAEAQDVRRHPAPAPRHEAWVHPRPAPRAELRHERLSPEFRRHWPATRVERRWVAPCYKTVIRGYDGCGAPIYATICVSDGYWVEGSVCLD